MDIEAGQESAVDLKGKMAQHMTNELKRQVNIAKVGLHKKDVLPMTLKAGEKVQVLTTSL